MRILRNFFSRLKNDGLKKTIYHYVSIAKNITYFLLTKLVKYLPLRNTIVFECESDMDDNPRAIYEYMMKEKMYRKYRFVWIVKNVDFCEKHYANKNTVFVSRFDNTPKNKLKFNYYMSTAKYFLFSHPYWFKKIHEKQVVVHVGHGTPIKQTSKDFNSDCFDWLMVPTENVLDWYTQFWHCTPEKTFICGLTRNDFLYSGQTKKQTILKQLIPEYHNEALIMCMPTYKQSIHHNDSDVLDRYSLGVVNSEEDLFVLNKTLKQLNIQLIVKLHPLQKTEVLHTTKTTNIHYLQNQDLFLNKINLYELIGCSDALLTDVSSIIFDFLLLNKPIGLFMNSFIEYSRGYILDDPIEYMPGEKIYNFNQFLKFFEEFASGVDNYKDERKKICEFTNGKTGEKTCYCEDFVKWLLKKERK